MKLALRSSSTASWTCSAFAPRSLRSEARNTALHRLRGGRRRAADGWFVATVNGMPMEVGSVHNDSTAFWNEVLAWVDATLVAATAQQPRVKLVVCPEFALLPSDFLGSCASPMHARAAWCPWFRDAGTAGSRSCSAPGTHKVDAALSRMARRHRVALSINACDGQPSGNYNAQLLYGANGALLAKYHKAHPWFKRCFTTPSAPPVIVVNTTWGESLGMFTCFDIVHKQPARALLDSGIRTFLFSSVGVAGIVKRWWTLQHGTTLVASDGFAVAGSGVYRRGRRLRPEPTFVQSPSVLVTWVPYGHQSPPDGQSESL